MDASSCIFIIPFVIDQPDSLIISISGQTNVACFGENTGSVSVTATGGVSPYTYRLDTGPFQDNGSFGSLSAGDYIITVRDANNCERQIQVEMTFPSPGELFLIHSSGATRLKQKIFQVCPRAAIRLQ
jgi:hypothetical protein